MKSLPHFIRRYITVLCTMTLFIHTHAVASETLNITDNQSAYTNFNVDVYTEEVGKYYNIEEIQQKPFTEIASSKISRGYNQEDTWFHLKLHNTSKHDKNMVLTFTEVFHKIVDLYTISTETLHQKNGLRTPVKEREIKESQPSFYVPIKAGETQELYLRIKTSYGLFGEIQLKTQQRFEKDIQTNKYIFTAYFASIVMLLLYNLVLFLYLKEKIYFYYISYVSIFILWIANVKGFILPYINIHIYNFLQLAIPLFLALLILFTQSILETKKHFSRWHKVLTALMYLSIVGVIWIAIAFKSGFYFINIVALVIFTALFLVTLWSLYKKHSIAKIYLPALSIYIAGLGTLALLSLGVLPYTLLLSNIAVIAALVEIILFSLLLAYRINITRLESIESKEKLIKLEKSESSKLLQIVAERTKALNRANDELEEELAKKATLEKHLKHLASTDPMTELYNRRAFFDICSTEIRSAQYHKKPLTALIIDIDHFKNINDTYGHDVGDKVIIALAKLMNQTMRTSDYIARIGGEEFAVLMPQTDTISAYQIADRLRENVSKESINTGTECLQITVSIGLSHLDTEDEDIHMLMKRADTALYKAKETGRNQVCTIE